MDCSVQCSMCSIKCTGEDAGAFSGAGTMRSSERPATDVDLTVQTGEIKFRFIDEKYLSETNGPSVFFLIQFKNISFIKV